MRHTFECWAGRGGECRMGCHCECHPVHLDRATGYVKEPEVEGEDGPSLFDYLEAAYGVERAESLTIGIYKNIEKAGSLAFELTGWDEVDKEVYEKANEIESLIDAIEIDVIGDSSKDK